MRIFKGRHTRQQLIEDYAILLFGCLGTLIGSIDALKRLGIIPGTDFNIQSLIFFVEV